MTLVQRTRAVTRACVQIQPNALKLSYFWPMVTVVARGICVIYQQLISDLSLGLIHYEFRNIILTQEVMTGSFWNWANILNVFFSILWTFLIGFFFSFLIFFLVFHMFISLFSYPKWFCDLIIKYTEKKHFTRNIHHFWRRKNAWSDDSF